MAIAAHTTESNVLAKIQTSAERLPVAIYKLDASVDPTADDDRADGYSVNSIWMTTSGTWICKDDSPGAAVWALMSAPPVAPVVPVIPSSGINYIVSGDAEIDTTGWSTYDDVTSVIDGAGGSPSVTWTNAETSNPLRKTRSFVFTKGASNLDNEGVSYDFTIDQADRGRTLGISFDYRLLSGTFWDDDIQIWIYDITNAQLIQPAIYKLTGMNTVVAGYFQSYFQTATNSTSYRLIFHNKNATATAYAVLFDNVRVSPDGTSLVTPITNWQSYTPTAQAITLSTGTARWRQVGGNLEIEWSVAITGNGTSSEVRLYFPPGIVADSNIPTPLFVGMLAAKLTIDYTQNGLFAQPGANYLTAGIMNGTNAWTSVFQSGTDGIYSGAGLSHLSFTASIPIQGWGSNIQVSSIESAVPLLTKVVMSVTQSGVTSDATVKWDTVKKDTHNLYNQSTGVFTFPSNGDYSYDGHAYGGGSSSFDTMSYHHMRGATEIATAYLFYVQGAGNVIPFAGKIVNIQAGDTVYFTGSMASGNMVGNAPAAIYSEITITKLQSSGVTLITAPYKNKTYFGNVSPGIQQTNGQYLIVSSLTGSSVSVMNCYVKIEQTSDGSWWATGNIRLDLGSSETNIDITIYGMKAEYSSCSAYSTTNGALIYTSGNDTHIAYTQGSYQYPNTSFNVKLMEKPIWAD